jgi:hypothetical protein
VRTWETSRLALLPYFEKLKLAELAAMEETAKCTPTVECTHCSASHVCQALQRSALSYCDYVELNVPFDLTPDQCGAELRKLQHAQTLLDARINGLSEQASANLKAGKRVPYFKLEVTQGRERWKATPDMLRMLGALYNVALMKPVEFITPNQAIKAGVHAEIVRKYTERLNGAMKLTPVTDADLRKQFKGSK